MKKCESVPAFMHLPALNARKIPNLPGNRLSPRLYRTKHSKSQTFGFVNGQRMEGAGNHDRPKFVKAPKVVSPWRKGSLPNSVYRDVFASPQKEWELAPAWDVFDRHVLRFYGFTKSITPESNLENHSVHKITILFYLEDDTAHILEPKVDCSGTQVFASAGGMQDKGLSSCILRRHKVPLSNGEVLTPKHLRLGENIEIYGTTYRLTGCDQFTMEYYQSIDNPQPVDYSPRAPPQDAFDLLNQQKASGKPISLPKTNDKYYIETMLGGGHCNRNMQNFLEVSKVCRFYASVDDLKTPIFERRPFIVLVFVVDNSIEIREQYPPNCGRENFPLYCRRGRMVKSGDCEVRGPMGPAYRSEDYLTLTDFEIGKTMRMCNTDFFLYDCDGFTRAYFETELKIVLGPKVDVRLPHPPLPRQATPPYTGFGSIEDSMGSVHHLVPKQPRKDMQKLFVNSGKVLRCSAKYGGDVAPEDLDRRFVFAYYLQDDTLMIYEPPQRNLGVVTGRYLEKGVHLNQVTGALFKPDDIKPGKTAKVLSHEFIMLELDEYTRRYFEDDNGDEHEVRSAPADLDLVLAKFRQSLRQQFPLIRNIFHKFDFDHNGVLCYHEFDRALQKFAFVLTPEETLCIMRFFDKEGKGQVDYNAFCDALFEDASDTFQKQPVVDVTEATMQPYASQATLKTLDRAESERVRESVQKLGQLLYTRPNAVARLRQEIRKQTHERYCTVEQIRDALQCMGFTYDLDLIKRCVQYLMKDTAGDEPVTQIDHNVLLTQLKTTYHDMVAPR